MRASQRRGVGRRQDDDRRKHDGRRAERGELATRGPPPAARVASRARRRRAAARGRAACRVDELIRRGVAASPVPGTRSAHASRDVLHVTMREVAPRRGRGNRRRDPVRARGAASIGDLRIPLAAQHAASARARDEAAQPQRAFLPLGVGGDRRGAGAAQHARERAFRRGCERGRAIGQRCQRRHEIGTVARHSIASAPCPGAGRLSSGSSSAVTRRMARALERRGGDDQRVATAGVEERRRVSTSPRTHLIASAG